MAEGADLDPQACMQAVAEDIRTVGWSVSAVLGDEIAPPWAYTVGLWLSHQGPELTMFGLDDWIASFNDGTTLAAPRGAGGSDGQPVVLGTRPEHLRLASEGGIASRVVVWSRSGFSCSLS